MIGIVLAAGAGRRLRPLTDALPKALAPVDGDRTILDFTLANFGEVGLTEVVVVVGFAAAAVADRVPELQARHGVSLELVHNPKAEEWNNAYSLWCARDHFARGFVLANGDTLHPSDVERTLLGPEVDGVLLALDDVDTLGEEEMKVSLDRSGAVTRITKLMDPADAAGEYIGLARVAAGAAAALTDALEATWRRNPDLYYEDGFQELVDRGHRIEVASIGAAQWTEVDDHVDLARAREIACLLSSD
jgi:choline kinase